jgi:oxygen-independent coproporphyrinogen III oxidase
VKLTPSAGLTPRLSTASDESHRLRELIVRAPRTCLYLHLPFCPSLCPYCDFAVVVGSHDKHGEYLVAVKQEMRHRRQQDNWDALHTLFLGGGTPTFIPAKQIAALLEGTQDIFGWRPDIEVSVEANPETIDDESMRILAAAGVNRVSIGAQSFDNNVLKELGRNHDASLLPRAVDMVRNAGIERINLDLIYGSTSETDASWERSVKAALDTGVTHLSVYALTIEDRTVFGKRAQNRSHTIPRRGCPGRPISASNPNDRGDWPTPIRGVQLCKTGS